MVALMSSHRSWRFERDAWTPLVTIIGSRLGMYTGRSTFEHACGLLVGFSLGRDDNTLTLFNEWLRATRGAASNIGFPSIVIDDVLASNRSGNWRPLSEQEDAGCVQRLSELLSDFLADDRFVENWTGAGVALRRLSEITELQPDIDIEWLLDSGYFLGALRRLDLFFAKSEPTPEQHRLLQVARTGLNRA
jgi:hypothetical protein